MLWKLIFEQYMKVFWIFLVNIVAKVTVLHIPANVTKQFVKLERVLSLERTLMMNHTSANIVQRNSIIKWH